MSDLYHVSYRKLVAQVFAFTTDLTEAQDAVQEAFARALARRNGLSDIDSPEAWLRTVAVNIVRRRWRRKQLLNTILLRERPLTKMLEDPPEPDRTDLRDALASLPRSYREVIVLHYLADLSVDEVAAILEVPVGTVKSRLSRGREALKGLLDDVETPPLDQVKKRAGQIRTRRAVAKTSTALVLVCASAFAFFSLRPPEMPPVTPPNPSPTVTIHSGSGITIHGIFDPATAPDLPGTITSLDMITPTEGWLSTSETEAHTLDGGQTWTQEPKSTNDDIISLPVGFPILWHSRMPSGTQLGAGISNGVPTVVFGPDGPPISLGGTADGVTGTVRGNEVTVMALNGKTIIGVYRGNAAGFQKISDGGGMTVSGQPIVLPDGRILVVDTQSRWQLSEDNGATWKDPGRDLPNVGSLHATRTGYVALDLFRTGWVAISADGVTWQKLPIR